MAEDTPWYGPAKPKPFAVRGSIFTWGDGMSRASKAEPELSAWAKAVDWEEPSDDEDDEPSSGEAAKLRLEAMVDEPVSMFLQSASYARPMVSSTTMASEMSVTSTTAGSVTGMPNIGISTTAIPNGQLLSSRQPSTAGVSDLYSVQSATSSSRPSSAGSDQSSSSSSSSESQSESDAVPSLVRRVTGHGIGGAGGAGMQRSQRLLSIGSVPKGWDPSRRATIGGTTAEIEAAFLQASGSRRDWLRNGAGAGHEADREGEDGLSRKPRVEVTASMPVLPRVSDGSFPSKVRLQPIRSLHNIARKRVVPWPGPRLDEEDEECLEEEEDVDQGPAIGREDNSDSTGSEDTDEMDESGYRHSTAFEGTDRVGVAAREIDANHALWGVFGDRAKLGPLGLIDVFGNQFTRHVSLKSGSSAIYESAPTLRQHPRGWKRGRLLTGDGLEEEEWESAERIRWRSEPELALEERRASGEQHVFDEQPVLIKAISDPGRGLSDSILLQDSWSVPAHTTLVTRGQSLPGLLPSNEERLSVTANTTCVEIRYSRSAGASGQTLDNEFGDSINIWLKEAKDRRESGRSASNRKEEDEVEETEGRQDEKQIYPEQLTEGSTYASTENVRGEHGIGGTETLSRRGLEDIEEDHEVATQEDAYLPFTKEEDSSVYGSDISVNSDVTTSSASGESKISLINRLGVSNEKLIGQFRSLEDQFLAGAVERVSSPSAPGEIRINASKRCTTGAAGSQRSVSFRKRPHTTSNLSKCNLPSPNHPIYPHHVLLTPTQSSTNLTSDFDVFRNLPVLSDASSVSQQKHYHFSSRVGTPATGQRMRTPLDLNAHIYLQNMDSEHRQPPGHQIPEEYFPADQVEPKLPPIPGATRTRSDGPPLSNSVPLGSRVQREACRPTSMVAKASGQRQPQSPRRPVTASGLVLDVNNLVTQVKSSIVAAQFWAPNQRSKRDTSNIARPVPRGGNSRPLTSSSLSPRNVSVVYYHNTQDSPTDHDVTSKWIRVLSPGTKRLII
ncbi:hypothetical protein DFS34DRAFT_591368 [Phlyctochytrium arcticum]|nr:hypothetical protein DFS34DRAFT_591368 [Phlyctochytrium arcticum]